MTQTKTQFTKYTYPVLPGGDCGWWCMLQARVLLVVSDTAAGDACAQCVIYNTSIQMCDNSMYYIKIMLRSSSVLNNIFLACIHFIIILGILYILSDYI